MAEISRTNSVLPQLQKYQSRGVQIKDTPGNNSAGADNFADAKMWDSITNSIMKVVEVNKRMDDAALNLEKNQINADINSHKLSQGTYVDQNINGLTAAQLSATAFDSDFLNEKTALKPFKANEKYSKKSLEDMAPFIQNAENVFKAETKAKYNQELKKRTDSELLNMEKKSLDGFYLQLTSIDNEIEDINKTDNPIIKRLSTGKNVNKFKKDMDIAKSDKQNAIAETLLVNYAKLLEMKVDSKIMDAKTKTRKINAYGEALGNIIFTHMAKLDPEKAYNLAIKEGIVVDGGKGIGKIVYRDPKVAEFIINQKRIKNTERKTNLRKRWILLEAIKYGENPGSAEKFWEVYDPNATKKILNPKAIEASVTDPQELQPKTWINKKYTKEDQSKMVEILWKNVGKKNGFETKEEMEIGILSMLIKAKSSTKEYENHLKAEKKQEDQKFIITVNSAVQLITRQEDKSKRHVQLSNYGYDVDPDKNIYVPSQELLDKYIEGGLTPQKAFDLAQGAMAGVTPHIPGSGLGPDLPKLLEAQDRYYRQEIRIDGVSNATVHPLEDEQTYEGSKLTIKEREKVNVNERHYKAIKSFNENGFLDLNHNDLHAKWLKEVKNVQSPDGKRKASRAWFKVGASYEREILAKRIELLMTDPNKAAMQDLKIVYDFNATPENARVITDDEKTLINEWYESNGQDRSKFYGGKIEGKDTWIYMPNAQYQTFFDPFRDTRNSQTEQNKAQSKLD